MKLLTNDEIRVRRNIEVKNEIDSGVQLAKKVDELRVLKSKEESSLKEFREKTVPIVTSEISELINKRDALKDEVINLGKERERLLIPLDEEWEKARKASEEASQKRTFLDQREIAIVSRENSLNKKDKELKIEQERIAEEKEAQHKLLNDAFAAKNEAEAIRKDAVSFKEEIERFRQKTESELNEIAASTEAKRRDAENWHERLLKRQKEQDNRDKYLNDKYATLQRSIARFNKQDEIKL